MIFIIRAALFSHRLKHWSLLKKWTYTKSIFVLIACEIIIYSRESIAAAKEASAWRNGKAAGEIEPEITMMTMISLSEALWAIERLWVSIKCFSSGYWQKERSHFFFFKWNKTDMNARKRNIKELPEETFSVCHLFVFYFLFL